MSATTRHIAQHALVRLEWIERHVQARPNDRETRERLVDEIDDLMALLLRLVGAPRHRPTTRANLGKAQEASPADVLAPPVQTP